MSTKPRDANDLGAASAPPAARRGARLTQLLGKLAARTDHDGAPRPGYAGNVAALRAEIATLEAYAPQTPENAA